MTDKPRIAILGAGNFGTALAHVLGCQGLSVGLWDHFPDVIQDLALHRENRRFLPGVLLSEHIQPIVSARECIQRAAVIVFSVPSAFIFGILNPLLDHLPPEALLMNVAKGFAQGTETPLIQELIRRAPQGRWLHLAGPCIAHDLAMGDGAFVTIAAHQSSHAQQAAGYLGGEYLRVNTSTDVVGASLGGILKNIYAILFGCLHALDGQSSNSVAAALTCCTQEMLRVAEAFGATQDTILGLPGLGDLVGTGFSSHSHNRKFGIQLASGRSAASIQESSGWLPEGAAAAQMLHRFTRDRGLATPLADWVHRTVQGQPPTLRELKQTLHCGLA